MRSSSQLAPFSDERSSQLHFEMYYQLLASLSLSNDNANTYMIQDHAGEEEAYLAKRNA
jgi:hypothetical protein